MYWLKLQSKEEEVHQHLQHLKEKITRQLKSGVEEPSEKLILIDTIQRLGVSYHFQSEIEDLLQHLHKNPPSWDGKAVDADLNSIALWFRLLRQQGFHVSCGQSYFSYLNFFNHSFKLEIILWFALFSLYFLRFMQCHQKF